MIEFFLLVFPLIVIVKLLSNLLIIKLKDFSQLNIFSLDFRSVHTKDFC